MLDAVDRSQQRFARNSRCLAGVEPPVAGGGVVDVAVRLFTPHMWGCPRAGNPLVFWPGLDQSKSRTAPHFCAGTASQGTPHATLDPASDGRPTHPTPFPRDRRRPGTYPRSGRCSEAPTGLASRGQRPCASPGTHAPSRTSRGSHSARRRPYGGRRCRHGARRPCRPPCTTPGQAWLRRPPPRRAAAPATVALTPLRPAACREEPSCP